jgi:GGDEF domain-containing protein
MVPDGPNPSGRDPSDERDDEGRLSAAQEVGFDATRRDDVMSKLFANQPLRKRAILALYVGTVAVTLSAVAAAHFADAQALADERDAAVLLDLVREQQGLARRIASLAAPAAEGDVASEFQRGQVVSRFARTHEALRQADPALRVSASSAAAFRALYADGEHSLAADVQGFLERIRAADGGPSKDRTHGDAQVIAEFAGETFPNRLDALTKTYLRAAAARADALSATGSGLSILALLALLVQGLALAWPLWRRFGQYDAAFAAIGVTDPVTGALTAQSFTTRALGEIRRARRYRRPVSVMAIAPAFPPEILDTRALRTLHVRLSETLRPSDFVGILEGGVVSVMLPETDLYAAELAGHRIVREFESRPISVDGQAVAVDVRIGTAQVRADEGSPEKPLARATAALRAARAGTGERVAVSPLRELRPGPA